MTSDPVALARRAIAAANRNPKGPRMTDEPEITAQEKLDTLRCAVAMALAAHRNDRAAVAELLKGRADRPGDVIFELAKLPADLARGAAARHGEDFPVEQALADLLLHLPQTAPDPEEEA